MKMLTAMVMLILSISAFASTDIKTFHFDGSQSNVSLNLFAEKTHTEYRYEQRPSVCYRTVVHYETYCTPAPRQCHTRPVYRQIPYSCLETVRIPYEVKDYDVDANITLDVTALPGAVHGETFKFTLNGEDLTLTATSANKKYFVVLDKREYSSSMNGYVKYIDASYKASFIEAAPVLQTLSVSNISIKNSVLTFKTGPVVVPEHIGFHLNVQDAPILGGDTNLFDRELAPSEIALTPAADSTTAQVNIQNLGIKLKSGRYTFTAKTFFKFEGRLLNASQFETSASRTLIYKIR